MNLCISFVFFSVLPVENQIYFVYDFVYKESDCEDIDFLSSAWLSIGFSSSIPLSITENQK